MMKASRWIQRFNNFKQALARLQEAVELAAQRPLTKLEEQGLIQAFEFTHELAWNSLKDFLQNRRVIGLYGSKDTTREAFRQGLLSHGDIWLEMIRDRNLTFHTYNAQIASAIVVAIFDRYYSEFVLLKERLENLKGAEVE